MSGIASLFGGNSAKTDRKQQLDARDNLRNVFSTALPAGQEAQSTGSNVVGQASDYFGRMLRSSRTETAEAAAPAINANLSASDATKRREAITGTGRTGGTAEGMRMIDADTDSANADIINDTALKSKALGAQGSLVAGQVQLRQALGLLGLSDEAMNQILGDTTKSRATSQALHNSAYDRVGEDVGNILSYDWMPNKAGEQSGMAGIGKLLAGFF